MQINISDLPEDIQTQLPLSIRMSDTHQLDELPIQIQYLISKYLDQATETEQEFSNFYDVEPILSARNDLQIIKNKKDLVGEYLKNGLLCEVSAFPFDVTFGSKLKQYLQTQDKFLQQTLISNEVTNIANFIASDYDINIKVLSVTINPVQSGTNIHDYTYVNAKIVLEVENEPLSIEVGV